MGILGEIDLMPVTDVFISLWILVTTSLSCGSVIISLEVIRAKKNKLDVVEESVVSLKKWQ
jgi:hypothetical protein